MKVPGELVKEIKGGIKAKVQYGLCSGVRIQYSH